MIDKAATQNIVTNKKITTIYWAISRLPEFYVDILSMIYLHTKSMAWTASSLGIPIKRLYENRDHGISMLEEISGEKIIIYDENYKKLLELAFEKKAEDENKQIEDELERSDVDAEYQKLLNYIRKQRFSMLISSIRGLYYEIYEKTKDFLERREPLD